MNWSWVSEIYKKIILSIGMANQASCWFWYLLKIHFIFLLQLLSIIKLKLRGCCIRNGRTIIIIIMVSRRRQGWWWSCAVRCSMDVVVDVYYHADDEKDHEETVNNSSFRHWKKSSIVIFIIMMMMWCDSGCWCYVLALQYLAQLNWIFFLYIMLLKNKYGNDY